jgi:hypothetical protein
LYLTSNIFDKFICSPASLQDGHCHVFREAIQGQVCKDEEINIEAKSAQPKKAGSGRAVESSPVPKPNRKPKPKLKKVPKHATVEDDDGESDSGESDLGGPEVESSDPGERIRYPIRHGLHSEQYKWSGIGAPYNMRVVCTAQEQTVASYTDCR